LIDNKNMEQRQRKYWLDVNGEKVANRFTNKHHSAFEEAWYQKSYELQRYRALGGFINQMLITVHAELHKNVGPPIIPSKDLIWELIMNMGGKKDLDPATQLNFTINRLDELSNPQSDGYHTTMVTEAELLHENLVQQRNFIELGRVVLLQ
jgi:hypothetical protein